MNILSGCSRRRFMSSINHGVYSKIHSYKYKFDGQPRVLNSVFDHKIYSILDLPIDDEWWFWLDDDAFFTDFESSFDALNIPFDDNLFVFAKSPVNLQGGWTYLSSGNFFFKNNEEVKAFFKIVLERNIDQVRAWWDHDKLGLFTKGDQDRIVYELLTNEYYGDRTKLVKYEIFNTRPYHFDSYDDNFLVHFAGVGDKAVAIREFAQKFNLPTLSLVPSSLSHLEAEVIDQFSEHAAMSKPPNTL